MLKGSVRVPQCRGACKQRASCSERSLHPYTCTHTSTHQTPGSSRERICCTEYEAFFFFFFLESTVIHLWMGSKRRRGVLCKNLVINQKLKKKKKKAGSKNRMVAEKMYHPRPDFLIPFSIRPQTSPTFCLNEAFECSEYSCNSMQRARTQRDRDGVKEAQTERV